MKKTICLNMIVKNESKVIRRCLASVKPLIDYWIIVDTGSNDGTQAIIQEFMKDIPGELHEYPWVDFAHNRNQALALSKDKGDYLLFIDADEELVFDESFSLSFLNKDVYFFPIEQPSGINYFRESLIQNTSDWKWVGPVHETILGSQSKTYGLLSGVTNVSTTQDGHRSEDPDKYLKDAKVLEEALLKEPDNSRHAFYLALSYGNAKEYQKSLHWHERRINMGGSEQEVFYSLLSMGKILENLNEAAEKIISSYIKAYLYRPSRAEPLYFLANYYIRHGNYFFPYLLSKHGLSIPFTPDIIFVQHSIYDVGLLLQFADSSYAIGKYEETLAAYEELLKKEKISETQKQSIQRNIPLLHEMIKHQQQNPYKK